MESFHSNLLDWYDGNARKLPWRIEPAESKSGVLPDPYHIWLSEVMLQQTTVAAVKDYFAKFITLWPTVNDLARASQDDVMKAWAGLGYYSRARNLKKCADYVAHELNGQFPETQDGLLKLPGVGPYTSAAISTIAFQNKAPVVDGNIERVVTRYTANATPLPDAKKDCAEFVDVEMPQTRPGDFAQAMMDLGATVCTPRNPVCALCPVQTGCKSHQAGTMMSFPVKAPKKTKPHRKGAAFVLQRPDGAIWLRKRPDKGLLAGMSEVPTTDWTARADGNIGAASAPSEADWVSKGTINHVFTHFHLELEVWQAVGQAPDNHGWWADRDKVNSEALPTVMKKVISAAVPEAFKP